MTILTAQQPRLTNVSLHGQHSRVQKNDKNFDKITMSKFKRGQNIRVIAVANKPEISSLKNKFSISRPNPFIKFMERSILNMANRTQIQTL